MTIDLLRGYRCFRRWLFGSSAIASDAEEVRRASAELRSESEHLDDEVVKIKESPDPLAKLVHNLKSASFRASIRQGRAH